jgi:hypothetical protein
MAQRSEGIFPREKFDLDSAMEVQWDNTTQSPVPLNSVNVWRIVVLGAAGLGTSGEGGYVRVNTGGKYTDFYGEDIDANGVGIAHLRGSSIPEGQNGTWFDYYNGATADAVYLDAVDNVG